MLLFEVLVLGTWVITSSGADSLPTESNLSLESPESPAWSQIHLSNPHILETGRRKDQEYRCFGGRLENYPSPEAWLSWEMLWDVNREQVLSSNGGDTYLQHYVEESILHVAHESQLDARLILVAVMQESHGKAAASCATARESRCGIMHARQRHPFDASQPKRAILAAIRDGVHGRSGSEPGYAALLHSRPPVANLPPGNPYTAARMYDSGYVPENLDEVESGRANYVNDFANRLIGWDGRGKGFKTCRW